jgi:pimeloyl-ACP methyl ester carboxylesterase
VPDNRSTAPSAPGAPRAETPLRFRGPDGLALTGFVWPAAPPKRAPALLFTPGNGFAVQAYRPALAGLPADVAVHALNHRGHGGSEVPAALRDWDGMLADLRAYVEQHMAAPAILAGHSMGAMLSLRLAAEAPALVAGLLLLEPPLRFRRGEPLTPEQAELRDAFIERARNRRDRWASRAEAAAWFRGSVVYRLWDERAREGFVAAGLAAAPEGVALACPPWLEAACYETVPQQELYAWADAARCPALLLRGLDSPIANVPAFEELAAALPVCALLPVPGGHAFPLEHPRETGLRLAEGLRLLRGETGLALTAGAAARTG